MKRILVAALLGATTISSQGQGHLMISNYVDPYNQIAWSPTGRAVTEAEGLTFQMFYAYGAVSDSWAVNIPGLTFTVNDLFSWDPGRGHGPGGYFVNVDQIFPAWTPGTTVTLKYAVITAGYWAESDLWQESAGIQLSSEPPEQNFGPVPGLHIVPEPSTCALLGLGAVGLFLFRRLS